MCIRLSGPHVVLSKITFALCFTLCVVVVATPAFATALSDMVVEEINSLSNEIIAYIACMQ
jgi:predicted PurR-regulated permease PerM